MRMLSNLIYYCYSAPFTLNNAYQPNAGGQNSNQAQNQGYGQRGNLGERIVNFTPILITYTELLLDLLKNSLVVVCPVKPLQPPYPRSYDANAQYGYHAGAVGHSIENCRAFKTKVQSLINAGWITFQDQKPSLETNPLSIHGNASTSANVDQVAVIEQE